MNTLIKQHLLRAQRRMKEQADKHRSERVFNAGDWVYLKLQPYVQSSMAPRANQKLAFKFFGPFQIDSRVGSVAYKLILPASSQIHLVFHVSQLKQALLVKHQLSELPQALDGHQIPEQVLQHRVSSTNSSIVLQGLIKWSGLPRSLATWEDLESLKQRFPRAPAWGQAGSKGRGSVTAFGEPADSTEDQTPGAPDTGPATVARPAIEGKTSKRTRIPSTCVNGPQWA